MIRNFKKRVYESLDHSVPKTEQDLIKLMGSEFSITQFINELRGKPFIDDNSLSLEAIFMFIEDYFYNDIEQIEIDSWEFDGFVHGEEWFYFMFKNQNSFVNVGFSFNTSSNKLDVRAETSVAVGRIFGGVSIPLPSPNRYSSQSEYLIAILNTIADKGSRILKFTKKVLLSFDGLKKEIEDAHKELQRLYADYLGALEHYKELGGDVYNWEKNEKHRLESSFDISII